VTESQGGFGAGYGAGSYGASRFDDMIAFGSNSGTPGWPRAQMNRGRGGFDETGQARYGRGYDEDVLPDDAHSPFDEGVDSAASSPLPLRRRDSEGGSPAPPRRRAPLTIEGELVAKSTGTVSDFSAGDRVFHQKFGNGNVVAVDGNKLTIAFDKAGEKRVVDSFVERV
jgi:DNA helicase-2/ATP-dependent DNA helicase PcrA